MVSSLPLRRYVLICEHPAVDSNRAIEVAQKFPNAQVTGVDLHAMVPRFVLGGLQGYIAYQTSQCLP